MKPFFSYFGSKYKLAKHYGAPKHDLVIEPFAGSAAYSVYWEPKEVILIDQSPVIVSIWKYLISATEKQILDLPTDFEKVSDLGLEWGAENLIGFWCGKGKVTPSRTRSKWGREYANSNDCKVWGEPVKNRIASQLNKIRHWKVFEGHYNGIPINSKAHWFIDPPYIKAGKRYPYRDVDYEVLADFSKSRHGFVQVCENEGAEYLPFEKFRSINTYHHIRENGKRSEKYSHEVLFEKGE